MSATVLILPGLGNSGPGHWQSLWQKAHPEYRRVIQSEWRAPRCEDWRDRLEEAAAEAGENTVLVAHSTACALVGHWWHHYRRRVRGALLVAPSDTESPRYPRRPAGFAPMPLDRLPFATIVVASENDPAVSFERASVFSQAWGGKLVNAGRAGHIDEKSGYGPWPAGERLLARLLGGGPAESQTTGPD